MLPDIKLLSKNHRSRKAIIDFNNQFFAWVASVLDDPEQKAIFEQQTQQQFNDKNGGQVTIQFIEKGNHKESTFPEYQQQTIHALEKARSNGFLWEDMAVLVRKKNMLFLWQQPFNRKIFLLSPPSRYRWQVPPK